MSSILLLTLPVSASQEQFKDSIQDLVDGTNNSVGSLPTILSESDASQVVQCVIGPSHLAFLMQDGRICRVAFHVSSEYSHASKDQNSDDESSHPTCAKRPATSTSVDSNNQNERTFTLSGEALNTLSGTLGRWTHRVNPTSASQSGTTSTSSSVLASRAAVRGRGRIIRATRGRAATGWLSNRAVIPASAVPEELVSQAQVVLQGKSRQVIIRELQKTSLDVNLAVNNLLSRDDDDPDDAEEESYMQETYIPSEDLMSIFEAGIPGDEALVVQRGDAIFPEDLLYNPSYNRTEPSSSTRPTTQNDTSPATTQEETDKDLASRIRDRWWGMLMMEGKGKTTKTSAPTNNESQRSKMNDTTHRFGEVEWWKCEDEHGKTIKFSHIASLHSELLAICSEGFLHQWYWNDAESPVIQPNKHNHLRAKDMKLTNTDKLVKIAACNIRVSVVTSSNKIATWLDDTLSAVGHRLEHPLQLFNELKGSQVHQLHVCTLYSCVMTSSGQLYWWGVFPYEQRKKLLDKVKTKAKKSAIAGSSQIKPKTLVCIRSCPLYYPGAVGFTTVNGEPRVGKLLDKAWSITEKCRFEIIRPGLDKKNKDPLATTPSNQEDLGTSDAEKPEASTSKGFTHRKRKYSEEVTKKCKEEEWCLLDVIFVEEVRNVPIGEVLKVDGAYAMVHFSTKSLSSLSSDIKKTIDFDVMLKESVIRRKDELQIVKWTTPPKMPECYQKTPKQLILPTNSRVLTMSLDDDGVHAILRSAGLIRYTTFNLASGRVDSGGYLQPEPSNFLTKTSPYPANLLYSSVSSIVMLQDPNQCLYPLAKDNVGGIRNPFLLNLSSLSCYASAVKKTSSSQLAVTVLVMREDELVQNILRCDAESVSQYLRSIDGNKDLTSNAVLTKRDGNRNIFHVCVSTCIPSSNSKTNANPSNMADDLKDEPYEPSLWVPLFDGMSCLEVLLKSDVIKSYLYHLLSQRDSLGYTPFMTAVKVRAYGAALRLYEAIVQVSTENDAGKQDKEQFMMMIYPPNVDADMSPLQTLCCNDTCSFTWTGTKHINQDIFECKTCGLVGPLCCCTECAQVCHIGHECKLKHTSPTAYCDCWEKCPCKALTAGDQSLRLKLLHKLVDETDLSTKVNKKGQPILLFLALTVARQASEQMQYVPNRMSSTDTPKQRNNSTGRRVHSQTPPPDHGLEPPKFAKLALAYHLKNWKALKSMVIFGCSPSGNRRVSSLDDHVVSASMLDADEISNCLDSQNGAALLDNFVHKILVKCNGEFLEQLLQTLQSKMEESTASPEHDIVMIVAKRFIRAVIRIYVVLSSATNNTSKKKGVFAATSKCKRVFVSLNTVAAKELANIAATIFEPVRMGVVYPSAPFVLGSIPDSTTASDDLFSSLPLTERMPSSSSNHHVRFVEQPTTDEGTDEDRMNEDITSDSQARSIDDSQSHHESDVEIDMLNESDSDSDESNNGDVSVHTASTGNTSASGSSRRASRTGDGYFESAETESEADEEAEVDEDEEDEDDEDDDQTETRTDNNEQRNGNENSSSTPHALQWAVRNNQNVQSSSSNSTTTQVSGGGLVFLDAAHLRRSGASATNEGTVTNSMHSTPSALARTFSILIREVADLLCLTDDCCNLSGVCLPINENTTEKARTQIDSNLSSTWQWLCNVMDTTEAQLRFGASLTAVSDPNNPSHPLFENPSKTKTNNRSYGSAPTNILRSWGETRRKKRGTPTVGTLNDSSNARHDYLAYILSLMRSHESDHGDSLPKMEITSLRHVAYVLDTFIYYIRSRTPKSHPVMSNNIKTTPVVLQKLHDNDDDDDVEMTDRDEIPKDSSIDKSLRHKFFKRSDSTLVLGYEATDPYSTPLKEAIPLADRPHLLTPAARRDQLFGVVKNVEANAYPQPPTTIKHVQSELMKDDRLSLPPNVYLGRWRMCLELFGRVFLDDVGVEPNSVLNELGRFDVKEAKFRREMEKLRNSHQKDLYIEGLERPRALLLQQALRQMNSQFGRRVPDAGPLIVHRLKVSFKDEPGEGSGVARSFYTAISNAFLADEPIPALENIFSGARGLTHQLRARARERERDRRRTSSGTSQSLSAMIPRVVRRNERSSENTAIEIESCSLSVDAPPYSVASTELDDNASDDGILDTAIPLHKRELARRLHAKLIITNPEQASKVTGMLLELTPTQLIYLLTHEDVLSDKVLEAVDLINTQTSNSTMKCAEPTATVTPCNISLDEEEEEEHELDNAPLFFQPGKPGYYSPAPGKNSAERLSCMRNVGRIIGLCLLQNEICPLSFNRHVIKYLLRREIGWHDLAFFDPTLYESLRQLIEDSKKQNSCETFSALDLTFCIQLRPEEGGGSVELIKDGNQVEVKPENVHEYVRKYAKYRMENNAKKALESMRRGLLDVIPSIHLIGLTAEDFRLLLNGAGDINVQQLVSYTFFSDETGGEGQEKLIKFKRWFWSVVENMTPKQKQDLLYFWTSSPAMPSSADGFQPMPSVTVKPANDHQLPTANTCISRLYVPLYSSKATLRSKFLLAIKTKVFGFV